MLNKDEGFTLVEIMIVVAIVGLLAAIAIPNLLRARVNANDGAIRSNLRTFSSANESYRASQTPPTYAAAISELTSTSPEYIDSTWTSSTKHGFTLSYSVASSPASTFALYATPSTGSGGTVDYCVDQDGVIVAASSGVSGSSTGCSGGTPIGG